MSVRPTAGASAEVIAHHIEQHHCDTSLTDCVEVVCACGTTIGLSCGVCEELLFLVVRPGTWCPHADIAYAEHCI